MQVRVAQPLCDANFDGFNATIFAYGQTGSGKTHTVFGPSGAIETCAEQLEHDAKWHANAERRAATVDGLAAATKLPSSAGIVLRACDELLNCRSQTGTSCDAIEIR